MTEKLKLALSPADGARVIIEAFKAKSLPSPPSNDPRFPGGRYLNMEHANAAYHMANRGSYDGFQEALEYGQEHGLFVAAYGGTRIYLLDQTGDERMREMSK